MTIPMRNFDRLFNNLCKTIYFVINTLGIMFDWVGSYYSFNIQSTVREDCFSMSEVAKGMHRKQQMLYSANEIMCNTLKVQRRFKSNLDITSI